MLEVSRLLCQGVSLEPVAEYPKCALHLAISCSRLRTVNLLLAAGAPIITTFQDLDLLKRAYWSPDVSEAVQAVITTVSYLLT